MPGKLDGKVALITGAGSGIGKAAAILMAKEGAMVGVLGRTKDDLKEATDKINHIGGKAMVLEADISSPKDMENATKQLANQYGRLDIVFANAGINGVWAPWKT